MALVDQFVLERALKEKLNELNDNNENERKDNLSVLIDIYYQLKKIAYEKYFPQIVHLYPWYTDHGRLHVEAIIMALGSMLKPCFARLNEMELFLLLTSCIYHDVGMTRSRANHNEEIIPILENLDVIADISLRTMVNRIAKAHTSNVDLLTLSREAKCSFNNQPYTVRLRALAALLRLTDDISETRWRINPDLLPRVPIENKLFWYYAFVVDTVEIITGEMETVCEFNIRIQESVLMDEYILNGETKSFFEYVLERIEKSYKEKVTCSVEFRDIVIISSFKIKITILSDDYSKDLDSLDFEINEKYYSAVGIKEEFYKKNPEWTNENLRTKYSNRGKV